jgi:hypothetical protein
MIPVLRLNNSYVAEVGPSRKNVARIEWIKSTCIELKLETRLGERISSPGSRSCCAPDHRSDHECFFGLDMMIFINSQDTSTIMH